MQIQASICFHNSVAAAFCTKNTTADLDKNKKTTGTNSGGALKQNTC